MSKLFAAGSVQALDIGDSVSDGLSTFARFVPKFLGFLAILIIGYVIAKIVARMVDKLLRRVGFDRLLERSGVGRALEHSKYNGSDLVAKLVYYSLLLLTLTLAFGMFGPNPVSVLLSGVIAWLPKAVVAIVIVVVAFAIANAVRDIISSALAGMSYGKTLATIASVFIMALGIIAALNQIGVATTVTMPVLIAVLATAGGILVVGVGGGLVRPMQQRWERWLSRAETEVPAMRQQAAAYQRGREDAAAYPPPAPEPAVSERPVPPQPAAEQPLSEQPTVQQPYRGTTP
jgi:hypothetical protein